MIFSSLTFLCIFLPIVLAFYFNPILQSRKYKNFILLISSIVFYWVGIGKILWVIIGLIVFDYFFALLIENTVKFRKLLLAIIITCNLGVLFYYKYFSFCIEQYDLITKDTIMVNIILPIGISFVVFQSLSYIFDVYYKKTKAQKNLLSLIIYIIMFPQLVAGPIVRYCDINSELSERNETFSDFSKGIYRFVQGLGKKVILANNLAIVADEAFNLNMNMNLTTRMAWLGIIAYTLQIYFDFSGYSDMAIGLGRIFGFHFLENFNYPYISQNISEFWRRWHISLSTWFKDYIYIPLGGSRKGNVRKATNLFVVMFLSGIWHGANWTFICWGVYYGIILAIESLINKKHVNYSNNILKKMLRIMCCNVIIGIGWVIFRAESLTLAFSYIKTMFVIKKSSLIDDKFIILFTNYIVLFILSIFLATPFWKKIWEKVFCLKNRMIKIILQCLEIVTIIFIFLLSISFLSLGSYNPFIYYQF